jgi:ABC-type multidrug transport system fused ATPase/permease subunit
MLFQKFFFRLLFRDTSYLIKKARTEVLHESDMPALPDGLNPQTSQTVDRLPLKLSNWRFLFSLIRVYWFRLKRGYLFYAFAMLCSLLSPNLIHLFVTELERNSNLGRSIATGVALALCGVLSGLCLQHYFYATLGANQLITNDVNQLLFRQSLELSLQARTGAQVGDIVNHMSSDSDALADFPIILGDICWALIMIVGASALLFLYIGWSALAALIVLAGLVPLTQFVAKRFVQYEEKMMNEKDARITLMSQLLSAIRVIKFFAWEKAVASEVSVLRSAELKSRQKLARAEVLSGVSYVAVSSLVLFVALFVHSYRGFSLDAATIFTCIALFGLLEEPFGNLSRLFSRFSQGLVSSKRILDFLNTERVTNQVSSSATSSFALELKDVSFAHGTVPVVRNLNLQIPKGHSLAIVGPVGSGKTSLLQGLLSECHLLQGQMSIHPDLKRKAFVPQEAFIVNASLLDNVLFGEANVSKEHLRKAIHQACLEKDIRDLPAGLRTEIGEKGVNLSGGQKQRVSLARAAFANPNLVFLDDPLSAVDVETEKQLCDRLLFGEWEKNQVTRIVATHRLESLPRFHQILFLRDGEVRGLGTFQDLIANNSQFQDFYREHAKSHTGASMAAAATETAAAAAAALDDIKEDSRITEDEEREKGAVKASVYWNYLLSLRGPSENNWILVLLAFMSVLASALPLLQKGWLANYEKLGFHLEPLQAVQIYGLLGVLVLAMVLLNQLLWLERGLVAGRNFHDRMLQSILRAPVRFFDSTPVGRILQRFSRDLESVDIYLQWSFESFIHCILHVTVSLILVLGVLPLMIFVIAPTLWIYNRVQQDYRRPAREAKRFDSVARSPRYAHFKETLMGLVVIRAFDKREWFLRDFYQKLSHSQRMFYGHYMLNRWFSTRVPLIAGVISTSTLIGISCAVQQGWVTPGLAGLVTIYALTFWSQLNWGIRIFADIESRMTSVERLKFYSNIEAERIEGTAVARETWPEIGELVVENLQAQYASHLPLVLKGLSFRVPAGQRIGIVGRTGSGKTTLFQVLYRFLEASSGTIKIDGVDISSLDLERLRKSLAIVPQDPSLFMGTLRSNLDRYQEYSDAQVWKALDQAGLGVFVRGLNLQLQTPVAENGSNLSQGQRQLLCLARALLIRAKIVLMDEATASVDVQTDADVQRVIREQLKGVTMLIIAHRLGTVADCDQVIELADGQLKQIHNPARENQLALQALLEPKG